MRFPTHEALLTDVDQGRSGTGLSNSTHGDHGELPKAKEQGTILMFRAIRAAPAQGEERLNAFFQFYKQLNYKLNHQSWVSLSILKKNEHFLAGIFVSFPTSYF